MNELVFDARHMNQKKKKKITHQNCVSWVYLGDITTRDTFEYDHIPMFFLERKDYLCLPKDRFCHLERRSVSSAVDPRDERRFTS